MKKIIRYGLSGFLLMSLLLITGAYQISYQPTQEALEAYKNATPTSFGYEYNVSSSNHLIFYPGGLVSPLAYAPLAYELSLKGFRVSVVEVFLNLAITMPNALKGVDTSLSQRVVLMGHSLGGVAASIAMRTTEVDGLILLGSYPLDTNQIIGNPVYLSILGSEDGLLNQEEYDNAIKGLNIKEVIIEGGNHAQFGSYGSQRDDLEATISEKMQREHIIEAIMEWFYN